MKVLFLVILPFLSFAQGLQLSGVYSGSDGNLSSGLQAQLNVQTELGFDVTVGYGVSGLHDAYRIGAEAPVGPMRGGLTALVYDGVSNVWGVEAFLGGNVRISKTIEIPAGMYYGIMVPRAWYWGFRLGIRVNICECF